MDEKLLQFIWKHGLFDTTELKTVSGEPLVILHRGTWNNGEGPDFQNARIRIGNTLWAGHVEIHLNSSDWFKHGHSHSAQYQNVILHVVLTDDRKSPDELGHIPVLELWNRIDGELLNNYKKLMKKSTWIPCAQDVKSVDSLIVSSFVDRLVAERLEDKSKAIMQWHRECDEQWEVTFFHALARSMGYSRNTEAFLMLASRTPLNIIERHRDNLLQLESLLFGQAGLLSPFYKDEYPQTLWKEYLFLRQKYSLTPMTGKEWIFGQLRPSNFPTIRIAQLAALFHRHTRLLKTICDLNHIQQLYELFGIEASAYWNHHYRFDQMSATNRTRKLGKSTIHLLINNTVIPVLFAYGKESLKRELSDKALEWLFVLPPEKNSVLDKFTRWGFRNKSAADSQALMYLKKNYCEPRYCLDCAIGAQLVKGKFAL